jgi:basic membrane lipoprotein Med (substrate-binding protein (PBP1-ABC) superfamily)
MKKVFWVVLGTALVLSACGRQKTGDSTAASVGEIRVRLLTDSSGIDDRSFNAAAWRGIMAFYGNRSSRGDAYDVMTARTQDEYVLHIQQATDEGCDLIIATGATFAAALSETIVTRLEAVKERIDSGSISIAASHAGAKRLPGFPQDLKAMDD